MKNVSSYKTQLIDNKSKIQYLFESKGEKSIIKAIEYTPLKRISGRMIYNLGFGDYKDETGELFDDVNSNNGDIYKVFNTVLNTIPHFFEMNRNSAIWIQGSDGVENFKRIPCSVTCKKKCFRDTCKKFNRRIKTYGYFIDKFFEDLSKDYIFWGLNNKGLVQYMPNNEYVGILVYKKI